MSETKPLVISAPEPRTLDLIFTPEARRSSTNATTSTSRSGADGALTRRLVARARYIVGQPPLDRAKRWPHEIAALHLQRREQPDQQHALRRAVPARHPRRDHRRGLRRAGGRTRPGPRARPSPRHHRRGPRLPRRRRELWGGEATATARLISGSEIGIVGFGDLGRALNRVLAGFRARVRVYDPWLPPSLLMEAGVEPAPLERCWRRATSSSSSPRSPARTAASSAPRLSPACAPAPPSSCSAAPTSSTSRR